MSHKLFDHSILSNARVWAFLTQVDAAEAQASREAGCPRCGGALHSATYPRKPHGLAAALRDDVRRFSLCCSVCRRRVKPPSVRFFGRRFYVGALFVVVSALAVAGGVRLHTVARRWGVAPATLKRWRRWWLEAFPETREWRAKRGELAAPLARAVRLAHHHVEALAPRAVALAELAVLQPLGVLGLVLLPQQREGHALAPAFGVDLGPVRGDTLNARRDLRDGEQSRFERTLVEPLGQRPRQPGRACASNVIAHRRRRGLQGAGDGANRQPCLEEQS